MLRMLSYDHEGSSRHEPMSFLAQREGGSCLAAERFQKMCACFSSSSHERSFLTLRLAYQSTVAFFCFRRKTRFWSSMHGNVRLETQTWRSDRQMYRCRQRRFKEFQTSKHLRKPKSLYIQPYPWSSFCGWKLSRAQLFPLEPKR